MQQTDSLVMEKLKECINKFLFSGFLEKSVFKALKLR